MGLGGGVVGTVIFCDDVWCYEAVNDVGIHIGWGVARECVESEMGFCTVWSVFLFKLSKYDVVECGWCRWCWRG